MREDEFRHRAALFLVGRRKNLPAGRDAVDAGGDADVRHELHHDLDEFFPCDTATQGSADMGPQLWRRASKRRQRRHRDDLAGARIQHLALVDVAVDGLEHIGRKLGRDVAERSIDLVRGLPEDLTDFLCAARAALRSDCIVASFRRSR